MKYGEMKTRLTYREYRDLVNMILDWFHAGYQAELTWRTREQMLRLAHGFINGKKPPDCADFTKELKYFLLRYDGDGIEKIRKRIRKAIENQVKDYII